MKTDYKREAQLVLQAQCRDRQALEALLRGVQRDLFRYIASLVGRDGAEDVLQDVFLQICRKLGFLRDPQSFRPWIYRTASRASFAFLRKERRYVPIDPDDSSVEEIPAASSQSFPGFAGELMELIETLSPASRAVLMLHYMHEAPLEEVAAILEISIGTVKSRLAYGLSCLRESMEKEK